MVIYEVNLEVDNEIIGEFRKWLPGHIDEMLAIPGILDAQTSIDITSEFESGGASHSDLKSLDTVTRITVWYKMQSQEHLNEYFLSHAGRMRAPAVRQFGAKFRAQRRVLKMELPKTNILI